MAKHVPAWLLLSVLLREAAANEVEFLIMHNNDIHGRFPENTHTLGGAKAAGCGRTLHVLKEARKAAESKRGPPVIYLNAGDTYTGTAWFTVHGWKIAADFMNLLKPDAMCLGNHEFDNGIPGLMPFLKEAEFPILAANIDFRMEPEMKNGKVKPSVILKVKGRTIGVIGYVTPSTKLMGLTGDFDFEDEVIAVRRESEKLDKQGINIIIALGHSGFQMDMRVAKEVPLVDVVVGGHTHTFLWTGPPPDKETSGDVYPKVVAKKSGVKVPVVQAYAYTKYLGKLTVRFDTDGNLKSFDGRPIFMGPSIPQDPEALALLEKFRPEIDQLYENIIGQTYVYLDAEDCRIGECNFGNLILDSFVDFMASIYEGKYWTDTAIAIMNGGAIRMGLGQNKGDRNITKGDLLGALPFAQHLGCVTLTGRDLIRTLEVGVRSDGETSRGEFLQVSGLHIVYDLSKPVGSRVVSVKARCAKCDMPVYVPVVSNESYRLITTLFVIIGGDGHEVVRNEGKNLVVQNITELEAVERYVRDKKAVFPENDERIVILKTAVTSSASAFSLNVSIFLLVLLVARSI